MNEQITERNEKPADWLFAQARQYPLLCAEQEQETDQAKWQAVENLQALLVKAAPTRRYLQQWASNLLEKPPSLDTFTVREYYNLLKREQVELLEKGERRAELKILCEQLAGPADDKKDLAALLALQLPGVLVTGIAEMVLGEPKPREMAAALLHWRNLWPQSQRSDLFKLGTGKEQAIRAFLGHYQRARSKLVNHNLRLVYAIAGKSNSRGLPYEDVVQGGMLGLIRAAEKYNHERGYRFSTYAYNWINQSVRQYIDDTQGIVRYPAGINDKISRMYRERLEHLHNTGTEPNVYQLAEKLEMEPEALRRLKQVNNLAVPLDSSADAQDEGLSLAEILPESTFGSTAHEAENISLNRCLMDKLHVLQRAERKVVILRWGLEQLPPLTRAQVADRMGVSGEWVRQLELSALNKLRQDKGLMKTYEDYLPTRH
jgi:RNA polymerase sigma factor (sigma-70 family)